MEDGVSEKMLGLALGGGAYRGVAHLGVLKVFFLGRRAEAWFSFRNQ